MLGHAKVKMPWPEVDRKIAIQHRQLRRLTKPDFENRPLDTRTHCNVAPVSSEKDSHQLVHNLGGRFEVAVLRQAPVEMSNDFTIARLFDLLHRDSLCEKPAFAK